ncbi:hexose kinase [Candidatus Chloroploca sp. M-50]|uniref:Hexose kinase n=1 Tax=Candidatus Chloroploca mongolica TaxID=2528176 RepID=A0ABS4DBF3_9CHLR|nr:hexose kinase [Candidatus Chloroploca mongolica]MBP1466770.1 hexose kinase [Candidatus Chloroploca mongolica]
MTLLIITPNPALDRTMTFANLHFGMVQRTDQVVVAAGGKGLNVARAAHTLGQQALVCAPLGGYTGRYVAALAEAEGLVGSWYYHNAGETRTCVLLVDPEADDATALNEAGPSFGAADWAGFAASASKAALEAQLCIVSGSLPRGIDPASLGALIAQIQIQGQGLPLIIDTSGAALVAALAAQPWGIKVNGAELGAALGQSITSVGDAVPALSKLRGQGIALAAVSLGALGCVASNNEGTWHAQPPPITLVSSIGSGDSLLAGLATGLLRGMELPDALRLAVACGTADALTVGGGRIDPAQVAELAAATMLTKL